MATILLWTLFGYFIGAILFAVILGKIFVKQDIRDVSDGNPGGTNMWKAAGRLIPVHDSRIWLHGTLNEPGSLLSNLSLYDYRISPDWVVDRPPELFHDPSVR